MSADVDQEDKTEEPTEKRLSDAVEKGRIAFSREAPLFASLSAALVALVFVIPGRSAMLFAGLVGILDDPAGWRITRGEDALALAGPLACSAATFLWPVVAMLAVAGVVASVAQAAPRIVPDRIMPDLSRISPRAGLRRAFGARGLVEFAKSLIKLGAVGCVAGMMLIGQQGVLLTAMNDDPGALPERILELAVKTIAAVLVATLAVAAADLVWSRLLWRRDNRMSKHEVKEELKQAEGDRMIKARLRSLRLDRSRKRMLSAVPRATMVVVNPTHYAVAMRYVRSEGGAPIVLAKGVDLIALKIRAIAEAHEVPVVEDKPLARSLHAAVEVERPIPAEFYRAVAEIVHLIQQRKSGWAQRRA
jgi:flagellar biosynthetic protein FlhB